MTKFLLYIILADPGTLVTMHMSFWSLEACSLARDAALEDNPNIDIAICVPEHRSLENVFQTMDPNEAERWQD